MEDLVSFLSKEKPENFTKAVNQIDYFLIKKIKQCMLILKRDVIDVSKLMLNDSNGFSIKRIEFNNGLEYSIIKHSKDINRILYSMSLQPISDLDTYQLAKILDFLIDKIK